ncbi:Regulator of chromosome condensation (RCC1) family protein isoform 1 [Hibiscus syriacus]|uniref:Regulator of chromosome condensation (RCC1) family protein isoform 1 n=1 Tax=Hibiscus syriacus TaxID=106335 RepID=A0A6A2ZI23_HIBSY|nr:Regulator of chromosome condensation (RCC1) family protein isoform 1 [Hibiscus syriacus]
MEEEKMEMKKLGGYGGEVRVLEWETEWGAAEETMLLWGIQQPTFSKQNAFVSHSSLQLPLDACGHSLSILQSPSSLPLGAIELLSSGKTWSNWGSHVGSGVVGKFLEHAVDLGMLVLQGKKVVELGSAVDYCIGALLGAQVILTDLPDRLRNSLGDDPDNDLIEPLPDYGSRFPYSFLITSFDTVKLQVLRVVLSSRCALLGIARYDILIHMLLFRQGARVEIFEDFYFGRKWEHGINHAFITLIPKKLNPDSVEEFRPSALETVAGLAFIANEGIDYWRKKGLKGCLQTSISVLVNGLHRKSSTGQGLRQGCSLSPLLFNIVAKSKLFGINVEEEVLSEWASSVGCSMISSNRLLGTSSRMPCKIGKKLNSLMASFLWGDNEDKRKIHWVNWKSVCTSKLWCLGVLDVNLSNRALWKMGVEKGTRQGVWGVRFMGKRGVAGLSPPRVEVFLWQLAHQKVAVREELVKRVLGSDVIYSEGAVVDLLDTLIQLCGQQTTVFLSGELRNDTVLECFLEAAVKDFVVGRVDQSQWHPDYRTPRVVMYILVKK